MEGGMLWLATGAMPVPFLLMATQPPEPMAAAVFSAGEKTGLKPSFLAVLVAAVSACFANTLVSGAKMMSAAVLETTWFF